MDTSESLSLQGRSAVVTGAGGGLGRAEAVALARAGANVVVNDVSDTSETVADIEQAGAKAVSVHGDVSDGETAESLVRTARDHFGRLDVVVNNAGILRDRMVFAMSDQEWDDVIRVHLRGHFLLTRSAAAHWRAESKGSGAPVYGRVINTASEAFLLGAAGQPNYAAAKSGIAALTVSSSRALGRYGVRANAICPRARTAMTEDTFGDAPASGVDPLSVEHVAPLVAYLASPAADRVSGQVFVVHGGMVALMSAPTVERRFDAPGSTWRLSDLDEQIGDYFVGRDPEQIFSASELLSLP